jgi:peptidoglycan/xylan/chitin deacetylase (PgdA/CDA1 family)
MKSILLSFDIEEFDLPAEFGVEISRDDMFAIAGEGTRRILRTVNEAGARTTFFVTAAFAREFPDLVCEMKASGHEIASHGFSHTTFEPADLKRSRETLEEIVDAPVRGFRMARLAKVGKQDILDAGYEYESSLNPVWLPGRYRNFTAPLRPFREPCGLWQMPVSALPVVRFPLFWLSFKNLPLPLYLPMAKAAMSATGFFNMYSHPWEYHERAAEAQWHIPRYIVRHAGEDQRLRLKRLLASLGRSGTFETFGEYLARLPVVR